MCTNAFCKQSKYKIKFYPTKQLNFIYGVMIHEIKYILQVYQDKRDLLITWYDPNDVHTFGLTQGVSLVHLL